MSERHDDTLDRLLEKAATAHRFEPAPAGLAQCIEAKLQARRRHRRQAGLAIAAMIAVAATAGVLHRGRTHDNAASPIAMTPTPAPAAPTPAAVDVQVLGDVIVQPIETADPGVTVLWVYPVVRAPEPDVVPTLNSLDNALNKETS